MIKKLLLLLTFWLPFAAMAQEKGMHFEHGLSWEQIKAKAKAENKYIFVHCFTTGCEICPKMSANIFPQEKVGEFMNAKFLNVKVQMDQTPEDDEEVKKWYDDALKIKKDYVEKDDNIGRCPTFLVFSPEGTIVDQQVGAARDADMFLAQRAASLDPDQQYYTQVEKYKNGQKDTVFLRKLAYMAKDIGYEGIAFAAAKAYLTQQPELYTPGNIDFARAISVNPKDDMISSMQHSLETPDIINQLGGVEAKLVEIVGKEEVYAALRTINKSAPDWAAIEKKVKAKYPSIAEQLVLKTKIQYFSDKKDGDNAVANIVAYMKKYGNTADPYTLNEFARTTFEKCKDQKYIEQALEWSKRSFRENEMPAFMDTYANLLYKAGKKADALAWEEKAMNKANGEEKKNYETTLEKMKKGEKYWN
ncbi:DUF255 domain-containing protein [Chitinophaga polysaccharea]|uniref:DUF255 domain-containing protein n=1 Tax=Chitinophaga polysaccharea TaxID=1293035 RepID=UPI00115BBE44|nr:DUF255 domain-containing protein [Chitinophaga polysaccharea]